MGSDAGVGQQEQGNATGATRGAATDAATQAHFAARAARYSGGGETSLAILDLAALRDGERVLDVATGTGMVLFRLAEQVGSAGLAAGVDFTTAMLAQASHRRDAESGPASGTPALLAAHAAQLPFREASFDVVTCRLGVHHFSDPEAGLAAMAAVLRPGGRLVIADFVRPLDADEGAAHDRLERLRGHVYVEIYTAPRLEAMMARAGCPVVDRRGAEREQRAQDWLDGPNVDPGDRAELAAALVAVGERGGAGLEVRKVDGDLRFVRTDAVLLGVKGAVADGQAEP
jgi:ubiquinone/menaquinone biosynthesis C-methylase UbiE